MAKQKWEPPRADFPPLTGPGSILPTPMETKAPPGYDNAVKLVVNPEPILSDLVLRTPAPIEYDLTDVAVLHDLRKQGKLWRVKAEGCPCFLCVCETEAQAKCEFLGKYPDAKGKLKIDQLRA